MKYTTLLHVDPSQVWALNQNNAIYHEILDAIANWSWSGMSHNKKNAIYYEIHDVSAYRP